MGNCRSVLRVLNEASALRRRSLRQIFEDVWKEFTNLRADHACDGAKAPDMARKPWTFDRMVTKNMFGGMFSDRSTGLNGGMAMVPSAVVANSLAQAATGKAFSSGLKSIEFGGNNGTVAIASAIESALDVIDPETLR